MQKITPFLWFNDNAEAAVNRYMEIFKDGRVGTTSRNPQDGSVMVVSFRVNGQDLIAMNGGPRYQLSPAFSLVIHCESQDEIDYYWNALTADGGAANRCGWLSDAFGLSWQVIPVQLPTLMAQQDPAAAGRVMQALLKMDKIVLAELEAAATGQEA